jgi:hypothetical protein
MMKLRDLIESHLEIIYMNHIFGDKNKHLADYFMEIQAFRGLVPICSHCKSIRDEHNNWHSLEQYFMTHQEVEFSHTICPECARKYYSDIDNGR